MLLWIVFSVYVALFLLVVVIGDLLLWRQVHYFKRSWDEAGRPRGTFYVPNNSSSRLKTWLQSFSNFEDRYNWVVVGTLEKFLVSFYRRPTRVFLLYSVLLVPLLLFSVLLGDLINFRFLYSS